MDNIVYSVWLSEAVGAENKLYARLCDEYGGAYGVYSADKYELPSQFSGVTKRLSNKNLSGALKILDECRNCGIDIITREDARYPKRLLAITAPPFLIYVKGRLKALDEEVCISVVGTRDMSRAGELSAFRMGFGLAVGGAVVVSGLAQGIDSASHIGCLRAGGYTVAVLGCGHNAAQRKANRKLLNKIYERGVVISEYPPSMAAKRFTYPQRNRIISGLSQATVVVEAGEKSGALITARYAIKQGRSLFAVANNDGLLDYSGGVKLLEEGASLVRGAEDVLEHFELLYPHKINRQKAAQALLAFSAHYKEVGIPRRTKRDTKQAQTQKPQEKKPVTVKLEKESKEKCPRKLPASFDDSELGSFEREVCRAVYNKGKISADELCAILSSDAATISTALTALEICGFVTAKAGGIFEPIEEE